MGVMNPCPLAHCSNALNNVQEGLVERNQGHLLGLYVTGILPAARISNVQSILFGDGIATKLC